MSLRFNPDDYGGGCPHFEDDPVSAATCSVCKAPKPVAKPVSRPTNFGPYGPMIVGDAPTAASVWLYENWVHDRIRIHRADCVWCNYGAGFHDTTSTEHGQWAAFATYERAAAAARGAGRADTADCPQCRPAHAT